MNDPPLQKILIFFDETVEAHKSLEELLPKFFKPKGYEVTTYDLYHVRERRIDIGEIIHVYSPQTILFHLSGLNMEEFLNAEKLKTPETRLIIFSPIDEDLIHKTLKEQFGDQRRREIIPIPFVDIDEFIRIVANEPRKETEPSELHPKIGKERE